MPRHPVKLRARYWTQGGQTRLELSGPLDHLQRIKRELQANDSRFGVLVDGVPLDGHGPTGALTLGVWQVATGAEPVDDPLPGPNPAEWADGGGSTLPVGG